MTLRPLLAAAVAAGLAAASALAPALAKPAHHGVSAVVAYCKAHPNVDNPSIRDRDGMEDNSSAHDITEAGGNVWRCQSGKVLVCDGGASGSACYKLSPSLKPNKDIIDTCKATPELDFVAMATTVYSSSTWRCHLGKPVIIKTYPLDKRGYLKGTWAPLTDAKGRLRKHIDLGNDPR